MLLEIEGLNKSYRPRLGRGRPVLADDGIDLAIEAGHLYGLLGHDGTGRTTLVNQVVGLLRPDSGSIRIDGHDVWPTRATHARPARSSHRPSCPSTA